MSEVSEWKASLEYVPGDQEECVCVQDPKPKRCGPNIEIEFM
jgi:hypothetical protein